MKVVATLSNQARGSSQNLVFYHPHSPTKRPYPTQTACLSTKPWRTRVASNGGWRRLERKLRVLKKMELGWRSTHQKQNPGSFPGLGYLSENGRRTERSVNTNLNTVSAVTWKRVNPRHLHLLLHGVPSDSSLFCHSPLIGIRAPSTSAARLSRQGSKTQSGSIFRAVSSHPVPIPTPSEVSDLLKVCTVYRSHLGSGSTMFSPPSRHKASNKARTTRASSTRALSWSSSMLMTSELRTQTRRISKLYSTT
jgi:hypothetical protein